MCAFGCISGTQTGLNYVVCLLIMGLRKLMFVGLVLLHCFATDVISLKTTSSELDEQLVGEINRNWRLKTDVDS